MKAINDYCPFEWFYPRQIESVGRGVERIH